MTLLAAASMLLLLTAPGEALTQKNVVVTPKATDEIFANPGMGWQTFHTFANEDEALAGLPSSCAYFRWYWREIEPEDGKIDFRKLDGVIARARLAGQRVAFRVMCTGSSEYMDVPQWLRDEGCKGVEYEFEGRRHWVPIWEDPLFLEKHLRLIRELGRRYDARGVLDLVDIGSAGLWGEWHMSGTKEVSTGKPVAMPQPNTIIRIIDTYRSAFPRTPKVMLIGSDEGMKYAVTHGCGWRADCLGDLGGFSKTWNHMQNFYRQQLKATGAEDAWKSAPVAFETCWDMRKWKEEGWDIRYIFDYALSLHASFINNKSAPIPEGTRGEVERLLRRLGYRLVLRRMEHAPRVRAGSALVLTTEWENAGVAPPYRDLTLAVRLTPVGIKDAFGSLYGTTVGFKGMRPGVHTLKASFPLDETLRPGRYTLSIGVMDTGSRKPAVRLAIEGRDPDGWYPLSTVEVLPPRGERQSR